MKKINMLFDLIRTKCDDIKSLTNSAKIKEEKERKSCNLLIKYGLKIFVTNGNNYWNTSRG